MSHGGLPITASKPRGRRRADRSRRRTLRETRAPNERPSGSAAISRARVERRPQLLRRAASSVRRSRRRSIRGRRRRTAAGRARTPRRTTRRRRPTTCASGPSRDASAAIARSLSLTIVERLGRIATSAAAPASRARTRHPQSDRRTAAGRQASRPTARHRRPRQIAQPRADQAVAGGEMVIEKRQRPIRGQRRQPQRHPRELHRRRIEIDAVEASLGDLAPQRSRDPRR